LRPTQETVSTRLVIAGGGTGGHVFPGMAVAEAMKAFGPLEVLWIGTGRPVERNALSATGWDYRTLNVRPLKGTSPRELIHSLSGLPFLTIKARSWLRQFRPHVVLGLGGYVSGPVVLAARLLGVPAALHEQNLVPGLANRMASRMVKTVFISFEKTADFFPKNRVVLTGNPVRWSILNCGEKHTADEQGAKRVLILGGSQGASGLNMLVGSALSHLWRSGFPFEVVHQTGPRDRDEVESVYKEAGVPARISEFISDMGEAYSWADLVVCRAGAGTLAELTAVGKPSILIPYPSAAGGHQEANAMEVSGAGAAKYFREEDIGAVKLASEIQALLENPDRLAHMREDSRRLGRPGAAQQIASMLIGMTGRNFSRSETSNKTWKGFALRSHV
jgi:UDP-N-acetylglucosamine--N-acetylmuramyl-(pentapeptide) pyrophosphoryl-undecaprenol N-acetylglucosamine transferase